MPAWCVRGDDDVSGHPAGIDAVGEFCFLKDAQVHIGLGHPSQRQLQTSVSAVTNFVGAKPNQHPPPCRIPSTPLHPIPTYNFLPLPLRCRPHLRQPLTSSITGPILTTPAGPFRYCPRSCPFYPLFSLLCSVHLGMGSKKYLIFHLCVGSFTLCPNHGPTYETHSSKTANGFVSFLRPKIILN